LFGATFGIVKQIVAARGKAPNRVALVYEDDQQVAKWLTDRGHFPVVEILAALDPLQQPQLLVEEIDEVEGGNVSETEAAAPIPLAQ